MSKNTKHIISLTLIFLTFSNIFAQRGYYDAPYKRYEAELSSLTNGAVATPKSYSQTEIQSEASDQVCVNMNNSNASVEFTITEAADGLAIRYCVPDGESATIGIYNGTTKITSLSLTSTWSWEYLWSNGNSNNVGVLNQNPKMRFDEIRYKLPSKIAVSGKLKIVKESGNLHLDFIEMEAIPAVITAPANAVTYSGNGSNLQTFINSNGGKTIFLPAGEYAVDRQLYFGVNNTKLQGAGMWFTHINFTNVTYLKGGLLSNATDVSFSDLYLTTNCASRSNSYKAINGVFTSNSVIQNIWAEHFECGAWIAQYNTGGPAVADGFLLTNCRFRNNYADGINLCKGTTNAIVEHCSFRNNGDDDQAIWSANDLECTNNTFRYNTSENCWRAAGVAIYGGKNNKAHNLIIKDNLEVGIRLNNSFPGVGFNDEGTHIFHDITITSCGTFNDLYLNQVGAIDIFCTSTAGTQVKNIKFYNIDVLNSKNDAIFISKKSGDGIYNLSFENVTINGTGKEYPYNDVSNKNWARGYFVLFIGAPNGAGTYCGMNYSSREGNAAYDVGTLGQYPFSWTATTECLDPIIPIRDVQYTTSSPGVSPLLNTAVKVQGTITAILPTKQFYIQDAETEWSGIYVYDNTKNPVLGDNVTIQGTVAEYNALTEITTLTSYTVNSSGNIVNPIAITTSQMNNEKYESVLVSIKDAKCLTSPDIYGTWKVNDGSGITNIGSTIYTFVPVVNTYYDITGIGFERLLEFRILPRNSADIKINTTSISEVEINKYYSISPNPFDNKISILVSSNNYKPKNIYITNILGKIIKEVKFNNNFQSQFEIDLSNFAKGTYFMKIETNEGAFVNKIVKR